MGKYKSFFTTFCFITVVILTLSSPWVYDYVTTPNLKENTWYVDTYKGDDPFYEFKYDTIKVLSVKDGYFQYVYKQDTTLKFSGRIKYHKNLKPLKND